MRTIAAPRLGGRGVPYRRLALTKGGRTVGEGSSQTPPVGPQLNYNVRAELGEEASHQPAISQDLTAPCVKRSEVTRSEFA